MNENKDLRPFLFEIFQLLKEQNKDLGAVMNQVASLRDVLVGASPEFSRQFYERLEHWQTLGASHASASSAALDASIERLTKL
jgi:hypothetical protein